MALSVIPRGTLFVRSLLSQARAGSSGDPVEVARANYGDRVAYNVKATVAAGSIGSGDWGEALATPEQAEFFAIVRQQSILGRISGLREIPLNTRVQTVAAGLSAYWVSASAPKPLCKASILGSTLKPLKLAGLFVGTQELFRSANSSAEGRLRDDLSRAIAEEMDRAFIDPSNAGVTGERPASVTNGVVPIPSTNSPGTDIAALVEGFSGDLMASVFVTDPLTAAEIALARDAGGAFQFPDAGPRGGSLLGLPLIVSRSSPRDSSGGQLVLLDPTGIAFGAEGIRATTSEEATLEMVDDPAGPSEQVSMFQTNSVAILAEARVNWEVQRAGSVAVISGAGYATVSP